MEAISEENLIKIPKAVFESAESKEELEDWLLTHDPEFLREMERIQKEESGKGISLQEAKKTWLGN